MPEKIPENIAELTPEQLSLISGCKTETDVEALVLNGALGKASPDNRFFTGDHTNTVRGEVLETEYDAVTLVEKWKNLWDKLVRG